MDAVTGEHLPGLDLARLRDHLDRRRPGLFRGPLTAELLAGGKSNLTFLLSDGSSRWVLRRPPVGHLLATAHDMVREYRVISALKSSQVPVPRTLLLCDDAAVLGAHFYLMEFVEGTPYRRDKDLITLGPARTRAIGMALVDALVDLHAIDPVSVGLSDFGRPTGFLARQLGRWKKQLDGSRGRELPGIDHLYERLSVAIPASPAPTIVHGDYRLDNALVSDDDEITAVLDWELSTLGDPLTDLALLIAYAAWAELDGSSVSTASRAPGYPCPEQVISRYAEQSRRDLSALKWYIAFAFFKLAVVSEGIYFRRTNGQTVGAGFAGIEHQVVPLIDHGITTLQEI